MESGARFDQGEDDEQAQRRRRPRNNNSIVRLDVGGTHYSVSASLLQSYPDSMLARMCSSTWEGNRDEHGDGRIFIEGDGIVFRDILGYLRRGPTVLKYKSNKELHLLMTEADYFGLDELRDASDAVMLANDEDVNGVPICFGKDSWTRIQGQVRPRGYHASGFQHQSGNTKLFQQVTRFGQDTRRLTEDGTYLLFVRLYYSPHYRSPPGRHYRREQKDELCKVVVTRGRGEETIVRFGCLDHRDKEATNSFPMVATGTCMEIVNLYQGDKISIRYPSTRGHNGTQGPLNAIPNDTPNDMFQSFTVIKLSGTAAARFVRKRVPQDADMPQQTHAAWSPVGLLMPPSKFVPKLWNDGTALEPPVAGTYLVFGRIAVAAKSTTDPGEWERCDHSARFRVLFPDGRTLHSNHTITLSMSDKVVRGNLSEPCAFMDVMHLEPGCQLDFVTKGEVILENHGTANVPSGKIPWQSLTMMRLSPRLMFDRYAITQDGELDPRWTRTDFSLGPARDPLLNTRGHLLVVPNNQPMTLLVLASFPPLVGADKLALTVDGAAVAMSHTLPNSGHFHHFYEIVELDGHATLGVSKWTDNFVLDVLDDDIQFPLSTRGHLCVVQLD